MNSVGQSPTTPVIVTGGASGIGLACAEKLAEVGRPVGLWDINATAAKEAAERIASAAGVATLGIGIDVSSIDAVAPAVEQTRTSLGTIGGFVHAAGVSGVAALESITPDVWSQVLDVNLRAQVFILQAILPDLKASSGAAVVGISSINAHMGNAMNPAYSASKAGMLGLMVALADDISNSGIRINSVSPGHIDTPMMKPGFDHTAGLKESMEKRALLGRLGTPSEVASAVRFLLSDEASFITATELVVDGGNMSKQHI